MDFKVTLHVFARDRRDTRVLSRDVLLPFVPQMGTNLGVGVFPGTEDMGVEFTVDEIVYDIELGKFDAIHQPPAYGDDDIEEEIEMWTALGFVEDPDAVRPRRPRLRVVKDEPSEG